VASLLETSQSFLADQLVTHMSVSVTYTRNPSHGRDKTVTLSAVPGRPDGQRREPGQAGRVRLDDERLDFHIRAADLTLGGVAFDPERGDRIEVNGLVREVCPGEGVPCWARSDVFGDMVRVRTKLEGVA
jgi:hypothetical protein